MFSNRLRNLFNKSADENGLIPSTMVESIIKSHMGYPFSRQYLSDTQKEGFVKGVEVGKRTKYSYDSIIDVLEYLLVSESITGLFRGNVKDNRASIMKDGKEKGHGKDKSIEELAKFPVDVQVRCNVAFYFLHNWLSDIKSVSFNFYRDWNVFRNFVVADVVGYDDADFFRIPFFNRYIINKQWDSEIVRRIRPTSSLTTKDSGANLRDSISELDSFFKYANQDDKNKLITWMEVILVFENGSRWVTDEAKAALKQDVPSLDQDNLIDDWWMLSIIYFGMNEKITDNPYVL